MKWMKHLLDVVTLTLISLFLILVLYEEDSEILTGSRVMLEVESWDYQHSKAEVFEKFEKVAKDADIAIFKVVIDHKEHQVDKAIYAFNEKANHHTIAPMNTTYSYHHLTHDQLMQRDVRGDYFILDNIANKEQLKTALESVGLKVSMGSVQSWMIYGDVLINRGLLLPFVTLLIIYLLYHLHYRSRDFKTYATMRLHGYRFFNIFFLNIKKNYYQMVGISYKRRTLFDRIVEMVRIGRSTRIFCKSSHRSGYFILDDFIYKFVTVLYLTYPDRYSIDDKRAQTLSSVTCNESYL